MENQEFDLEYLEYKMDRCNNVDDLTAMFEKYMGEVKRLYDSNDINKKPVFVLKEEE